jgi:hypothetical protein
MRIKHRLRAEQINTESYSKKAQSPEYQNPTLVQISIADEEQTM